MKSANQLTAERIAATARAAHPCLARPGRRSCLCIGCRGFRSAARDVLEAMGMIEPGGSLVLPDFGEENPDTPIAKARAAAHREPRPRPLIDLQTRRATVPAGLRALPPAPAAQPKKKKLPPHDGTRLGRELAELEATDPKVAAAAQSLDDAVHRILSKPLPAAAAPQPKRGRPVAKCGTASGYARHLRLGETTCQPCRQAMADTHRERDHRRGVKPRPVPACGTPAGAKGHRRRGEKPCGACAEAMRAYQRQQYRARGRRFSEEQPKPAGVDLDQWLATAQQSPRRVVRRQAHMAVAALLQLRCALDDLARAERSSR